SCEPICWLAAAVGAAAAAGALVAAGAAAWGGAVVAAAWAGALVAAGLAAADVGAEAVGAADWHAANSDAPSAPPMAATRPTKARLLRTDECKMGWSIQTNAPLPQRRMLPARSQRSRSRARAGPSPLTQRGSCFSG